MDRLAHTEPNHSNLWLEAADRQFSHAITWKVAIQLLRRTEIVYDKRGNASGRIEAAAHEVAKWAHISEGAAREHIARICKTGCLVRSERFRTQFRWDFAKLLEGVEGAEQLTAQTGNDGATGGKILDFPPRKLSARAGRVASFSQNPRFNEEQQEDPRSTDQSAAKLSDDAARACIGIRTGRDRELTGELGRRVPASRARSRDRFPGGFSRLDWAESAAQLVQELFDATRGDFAHRDDFDAWDYFDEVAEYVGAEFVRIEKNDKGGHGSKCWHLGCDIDWLINCSSYNRPWLIKRAFFARHKQLMAVAGSVVRPTVDTTPPPDSQQRATGAAAVAEAAARAERQAS